MPNHTTCVLTVKTNKKEFDKIKKFMASECTNEKDKKEIIPFDFNKVIPMPDDLKDVTSPVRIVSQKEYDEAAKKRKANPSTDSFGIDTLPLTKKMQKAYLKKYGHDNWYSWALAKWGTKWGAYDFDGGTGWNDNKISFFTAWSPPLPVIEVLSQKFPNAVFTIEYADEGGGWVGTTVFKDGLLADKCLTDSTSSEFQELFCKLRGKS